MWLQLPRKLTRVPCSLLIASLALAGLALPVKSAENKVLTPDTFKPTISKGYWFVEHFSPWCHHCRAFAPTWEELVTDYDGTAVHLAQINCAVDGDLCTENGVNGYPQMNLYRDGAFVKTFNGGRSRERITTFISEETSISPARDSSSSDDSTAHDLQTPHTDPPKPDLNPEGEVLVLTAETFAAASASGNVFVKFFAPWCGHCKKLAPIWTKLAHEMQHKMTIAEVNCDDYKSLCTAQGVTGFPMLFLYPPYGKKAEFTGKRRLDAMKAWLERAVKPSVLELKYEDFEQTVKDDPVVYLFLHETDDSRLANTVSLAAAPLLGSPPVYTSSSPAFLSRFSVPSSSTPILLAIKDHDASHAAATLRLTTQTDKNSLSDWLVANRLPTAMELSDSSFQEVMNAPSKPLVVLVAVPKEGSNERERLIKEITEIGQLWRRGPDNAATHQQRPVVFTWMDVDRWASWLKSMYGIKGTGQVVIADHGNLIYYDTDMSGNKIKLIPDSLFSALKGVMSGKARVRHSENIVERMARYLNAQMVSVENWAFAHRRLTIFIFVMGIVGAFFGIRKLFADDDPHVHRKEGRLD
ncbi:thioredoxin-domain-containing protein [Artomyces pyxidatus]|uniref:Thioredoxin-domain-containing protein n=1 Tax=Artomyces pyxidatus TaxID=48021 RepID=A0ACB8SME3_9AGAM|nr:thioredoxin-domain-containing protein [Artomyces pyxidatus]